MRKFFEANYLDILVLYSLGFIVLGVVLFVLPRQNTQSRFAVLMPFLAAFGLIHGATELSTFLKVEHHASGNILDWVTAALLFTSFIPLLEFGRRMILADASGMQPAALSYATLTLVILSLSKFSNDPHLGFVTATRFFLGFPASLLSSFAFWKQYRNVQKNNHFPDRSYLVAAIAFLIYGMATIVMPGNDSNLPALFMSQEQFLSLFGFPVEALRAICAVTMAMAVVYIVRNTNYECVLREFDRIREIKQMSEFKHINEMLIREIEQRHHVEQQLKVLSMAFETQEAVMITDADEVILRVNQAFTRDTGYTAEEVVGKTPGLLKSGLHNMDFHHEIREALAQTGTWQGEIRDRRKNGEVFPIWITISAIKNENGSVTHYVWSQIDITERKCAEEKISFMAYHDQLTALPNRELFYDRLSQAMSQARRKHDRLALLYMDLDGFKAINDHYGHNIGDAVLKTTADRILSCVRDVDTVARLGGDEFAVVLGEIRNPEDVICVSEKIITRLTEPVQLQDMRECSIGVSIGIALYPENGAEIDKLMSAADGAMYESKAAGKGIFTFSTRQASGDAENRPCVLP